jgi:hypothetical protein
MKSDKALGGWWQFMAKLFEVRGITDFSLSKCGIINCTRGMAVLQTLSNMSSGFENCGLNRDRAA